MEENKLDIKILKLLSYEVSELQFNNCVTVACCMWTVSYNLMTASLWRVVCGL